MPIDDLKARVKQRLEQLSLSARQASLRAGLAPDTVGKVLLNKTQHLRGDNMAKLARVLGVSTAWLATGEDEPPLTGEEGVGVAFGGIAEAGAFRPWDGLNQSADARHIPIAADPRYPSAMQYAFQVEGDSMDEARIFPGMWVLAVDVHAWERRYGEVTDGLRVVVARTRNANPERELTIKRLRIFRDRVELRPESSNAKHQALVMPYPPVDHPAEEITIIAVVLAATWLF